MCETGVGDISEDPLDCREEARHGNEPEWEKEIYCHIAKQNM